MTMNSSERRWCAGLFVAALLLRIAHWATLHRSPFGERLLLDPQYYDAWARKIVAGAWIGDRPFFQDPLYAYFLALVYAIGGPSPRTALFVQLILGACVAPLVYFAARRGIGESEARFAGLLAAGYLPSLVYEGMLEKTWLATLAVAASLAVVAWADERQRVWGWGAAGFLFGLAVLARGNLLLVGPLLALGALLPRPQEKPAVRNSRRRAALALLCGMASVLLPVAVRNRSVVGEWFLTTANVGQNFYIGNNPANRDGEYSVLPFVDPDPTHEEADFAREAERRSGRALGPSAVSRFWLRQGVSWIRSEPVAWLRLTLLKFHGFWGAYEIPDTVDVDLLREDSPVLRLPLPGFGIVGALACIGMAVAIRRRGFPRLLVGFVLTYTVSVVAFFVLSRFRMAMMPAIFALAGLGLAVLIRELRGIRRTPWRATVLLVGLVAAMAGVALPIRGAEGTPRVALARAIGLPTRVESQATSRFNLGVLYAAEAAAGRADDPRLIRAETELRKAAAASPEIAKVWVELGKVLARQERYVEARAAFERGLAIDPGPAAAWHALGIVCRRVGDLDGAQAAFTASVARDPRHATGWTALGETHLAAGRAQEAAEAFRRALAVDPALARAQDGLTRAEQALGAQ